MARRKDAVALFEVITATKRKQEAAAAANQSAPQPALRTPKWWFKNRTKQPAQSETIDINSFGPPPALPPAQYAQQPQYSHPQLESAADPTAGVTSQAVVQRVQHAPQPERVTIPERSQGVDPFGLDIPDAPETPTRSQRPWFNRGLRKVAVDPDRREVTVRFRYTTAIIAGFAVCVAIGLAYLSGRKSDTANAGPNRLTSEQVRRGEINPHVLDLASGRDSAESDKLPPTNDNIDEDLARPASDRRTAPPVDVPTPAGISAGPGVEKGLPRQMNLNYVIVERYDNEKAAVEAVKALDAAGIPCTIERKLKGWSEVEDRYLVVGMHGFSKMKSSPEYNNYVRSIESVGNRLAATSKAKPFKPSPYRWKPQQ